MGEASQEEHRAACRVAGQSVGAALLGFTLRRVCIRPAEDKLHFSGFAALAEPTASFEEEAFMDLAGMWAELDGVDFPDAPERAKAKAMGLFPQIYPAIDVARTRHGIDTLVDRYREAVRALARELLLRKELNGIECGKIIMTHGRRSKGPERPTTH